MKYTYKSLVCLAVTLTSMLATAADKPPCTGGKKEGCSSDCANPADANSYKCQEFNGPTGKFNYDSEGADKKYISTTDNCAHKFIATYDTFNKKWNCDKTSAGGCGSKPDAKCKSATE